MNTESPVPAYIAYSVGFYDDRDIVDWALAYLPTSEHFSDDPDLLEISWINTKQVRNVEAAGMLLEKFIEKMWPEYELIGNAKAEHYARRFFKHRLESYADGKCSPWMVCRMVSPIEHFFDFPDWLGDMYDACDWIEPNTSRVDCRHLEAAVIQTLKEL